MWMLFFAAARALIRLLQGVYARHKGKREARSWDWCPRPAGHVGGHLSGGADWCFGRLSELVVHLVVAQFSFSVLSRQSIAFSQEIALQRTGLLFHSRRGGEWSGVNSTLAATTTPLASFLT